MDYSPTTDFSLDFFKSSFPQGRKANDIILSVIASRRTACASFGRSVAIQFWNSAFSNNKAAFPKWRRASPLCFPCGLHAYPLLSKKNKKRGGKVSLLSLLVKGRIFSYRYFISNSNHAILSKLIIHLANIVSRIIISLWFYYLLIFVHITRRESSLNDIKFSFAYRATFGKSFFRYGN